MWRKDFVAIVALLSLSMGFSGVEAVVLIHQIEVGDTIVADVDIDEPYSGTADLKFCLADYDYSDLSFNYRCDHFLDRYTIEFTNTFHKRYIFSTEGIGPQIYRLFVQLHYDDKYRRDCDNDNFVYIGSGDEPIVYISSPKGVRISVVGLNSTYELGSIISSSVNITNYENCSIFDIQSYVFGWRDGFVSTKEDYKINLSYGSSTQLNMTNALFDSIQTKDYIYKVLVLGCSNSYYWSRPVSIVEKAKPNVNVTLSNYTLYLKNFDSTNVSFSISIVLPNKSYLFNLTLLPHYQKIFYLNKTTQFISLHYGDVVKQFFVESNQCNSSTIDTNTTCTNFSFTLPTSTSNLVANKEEKSFYIVSLFSSLGLLFLLYKRLRL